MKYIAVLAYNGPEASEIQLDCVGVFGEEHAAKEAIDDYIASTLEIEREGYENLVVKIIPAD
jgi:hypothetical protein